MKKIALVEILKSPLFYFRGVKDLESSNLRSAASLLPFRELSRSSFNCLLMLGEMLFPRRWGLEKNPWAQTYSVAPTWDYP